MAYLSQYLEMSYDFSSAVPADDEEHIYYKKFKKIFGDDGTLLLVGFKDDRAYQVDNFKKLKILSEEIQALDGVEQVLALPLIWYLEKDTTNKKFIPRKVFEKMPDNQADLDSLLRFARNQKFYEDLLFNPQNQSSLILVAVNKNTLESYGRQELIKKMQALGASFTKGTQVELHYAGLPFVRSIVTGQVGDELKILLVLSGIATAVILFLFFHSLTAVIFPMIIIGIVVVWSMGLLVIFDYKVTILTGLLPPVLVVIGIPNCVYLLTKYHQEYRHLGDKHRALRRIIRKIGIVTFMTNATTAIGFAVFILMDNINLKQFGVISSICITAMFLVSIILLPAFYSFLPSPTEGELKHLDRKPLTKTLEMIHRLIFEYRIWVYAAVACLILVSLVGIFRLKTLSYMVDNIPLDSQPKKDLVFFEENFRGVMPLEIVVDTQKKRGATRLSTLKLVEKLERSLATVPELSKPLSLVTLIKATNQAFYNHHPDFYALPSNRDQVFIYNYMKGGQDSTTRRLLNTLVDSTGQKVRISYKVADVGSIALDSLIEQVIRPRVDSVFAKTNMKTHITGNTLIFLKGNDYLVGSVKSSLVLAIVLIAILMASLFGSIRIILISVFTNILPLMITAAIMGYFGISLKPSTGLVFSIAFGIAVDDSIHYLARYRQAILGTANSVPQAVSIALRETGNGMIYTSIVLFFGFIVFLYSDFDGTKALGYLTATTLLCAMFGNIILLPSLLLSFGSRRYHKNETQLIEYYNETEKDEQEDQEIDAPSVEVSKNPIHLNKNGQSQENKKGEQKNKG
ncbi:MAG: efflux RND transporter permease subunit [Microscillaceae bacterium]|nr:efflux RND transporter permease subunit [Microscillaceae bacterium]